MNPTCRACGGKCCKVITIPLGMPPPQKDREWMKARGTVFTENGTCYFMIESRCRWINDEGKCEAYERRPLICREYEVDGASCKRCRKRAP